MREAIDGLSEDQHPPGSVKSHGEGELYRVRVCNYRIVYQIQNAVLVVLVVQIGHRREIYRQQAARGFLENLALLLNASHVTSPIIATPGEIVGRFCR